MLRGLLIVFTGDGKGKTTAALGMALRAAGHGMRILILQFIKGAWSYGEIDAFAKIDNVTLKPLGTGFTWEKETLDEDRELARIGWEEAAKEIQKANYDMIVLDELNYVLHYGLLVEGPVIEVLKSRPRNLHVVVTGRNAPDDLISLADLVTEMRLVKHPYRDQGIKAQEGIEF
ncbi:MAG: cob(I)yrinic acid a,c-diamide adenosyltransferase [Syntrophobacteraceae bacterium]